MTTENDSEFILRKKIVQYNRLLKFILFELQRFDNCTFTPKICNSFIAKSLKIAVIFRIKIVQDKNKPFKITNILPSFDICAIISFKKDITV